MKKTNTKVLIVATSRKTRGGITSVIRAHEQGRHWDSFKCKWIETHRDGKRIRKVLYLICAFLKYIYYLPFYNIVHIHLALGNSGKRKLPFIKLAKFFKKKVIIHFHPATENILFNPENNKLGYEIFSRADLILVLSPQWEKWINEAYPCNNYKMKVLYNPCPKVKRTGVNRKKQILYAGTILKRKGYDVLLEAFAKVAHRFPEWKVVFAGNPSLKYGINEIEDGKKNAEKYGISSQIEWLGWISGAKKEEVFNESSIYCLASSGEGFPMGVLDAWAYGIPCVMTPVGGIPDIVRDGVEGLLFPVGDSFALSQQLERLMADPKLRENIVAAADKYVYDTFDVHTISNMLKDIYETV